MTYLVKYLKIDIHDLGAGLLILFATALRLLFAALGWPPTNADEGTMGIMALHIAYRGEHPLLFYGQNYMGSIEAYLGAMFFHLFGPSLLALRLGVMLLVMLFLISTYLLSRLLYSKSLGLAVLTLMSFGSIYVFTREMIATGGTSQTLLFGSLSFLLATWLCFTYHRHARFTTNLLRGLGYAIWGLVLGLGVWSDMIVLPVFALAGFLLLIFCWRDLLLWSWLPVLLGFVAGAWPLIEYNRETSPGEDSVTILLKLFQGSTTQAPHTLAGIVHGIAGTILVSIPMATNSPFCPVMELPWLGDTSPHTPTCTLLHAAWGGGYLALLGIAVLVATVSLWRILTHYRQVPDREKLVRAVARLCLLGAALLAIAAYAVSSAPQSWPGFHARYLSTLLIVTPAVLAPLWYGATSARVRAYLNTHMRTLRLGSWLRAFSWATLGVILALFLLGTGILIHELPAAQTQNHSEADLIHRLEHMGIMHVYTEYWSCDNMAFLSDEHIICEVVDANLQPTHNRDPRYATLVSNDPHAAYVFPVSMAQAQISALAHKVAQAPTKYSRYSFDGYIVVVPAHS
jgi:hypothetical protein